MNRVGKAGASRKDAHRELMNHARHLIAAQAKSQLLRRRNVLLAVFAGPPPPKPASDRSKPLSITLSEEQWLLVGGLLAQEIQNPTLPESVRVSAVKAALKIQQTINRLWRAELPAHLQGMVTNFGGQRWVTPEYLYGPEGTNGKQTT